MLELHGDRIIQAPMLMPPAFTPTAMRSPNLLERLRVEDLSTAIITRPGIESLADPLHRPSNMLSRFGSKKTIADARKAFGGPGRV